MISSGQGKNIHQRGWYANRISDAAYLARSWK